MLMGTFNAEFPKYTTTNLADDSKKTYQYHWIPFASSNDYVFII